MPEIPYEIRSLYPCKICGNVPDEFGMIEHGRGCYTQSPDGGGYSNVFPWPPEEYLKIKPNVRIREEYGEYLEALEAAEQRLIDLDLQRQDFEKRCTHADRGIGTDPMGDQVAINQCPDCGHCSQ